MSVPEPPVELEGGCSGVYQDTLYTFQSNAFQSLRLHDGAKWDKLDMGISVEGGKCVVGSIDGQDALFIVGGISEKENYSGLQRYTFENKQWRTVESPANNVRNRQMHGAAYLNTSSSIIVYAGYQDGSGGLQNSSQTFTISTRLPYLTKSHTSKAPPVANPILLPWNASHAVMAGGSPTNRQVWVFSEVDGWESVPILLPSALPDMTKVQASLLQGKNSSKFLELFDLGQSPNKVTTLLVQPANGRTLTFQQASIIPMIPDSSTDKAIDLSQMPQYDAMEAPTEIRNGFALAQSASGLVVISGGAGAQAPLSLFNQSANAWLNADRFFDPSPTSTSPSSSSLSSSVPTSTSLTPSTSPAPEENDVSGGEDRTRVILGSVLGGLFGITAILILLLLLFRRHKSRKGRSESALRVDTSHQMDIDDSRSGHGLNGGIVDSTEALNRGYVAKGMISKPQIQDERTWPDRGLTAFPSVFSNAGGIDGTDTDHGPRGWSSYFTAEDRDRRSINHASRALTHDTSDSRLTTYTEGSEHTGNGSHLHESAEVPPLNIRSSQIQSSHHNDHETFLGTSSSEQESWDPVGTSRGGWDRPASSVYAESASYPHPGKRVLISQFPGVPASRRASELNPPDHEDRGMRTMASRDFGGWPTGLPATNAGAVRRVTPGQSEPRSAGNALGSTRGRNEDDMSWLNLGNNR